MSLVFLLAACSNVEPPTWSGGGTRYATGTAADLTPDDTAGDTSTDTSGGDTAASEGGPELLSGSAMYVRNEAEQLYVQAGIAYTDDPDDVDGGTLYWKLLGDGSEIESGSRSISETGSDPDTQARVSSGTISFQRGPIEEGPAHTIKAYVIDFTRNRSNTIELTASER